MTKTTLTKKEGDIEYYEVDVSVPYPEQYIDLDNNVHDDLAKKNSEDQRVINENEEASGREIGVTDKRHDFKKRQQGVR